MFDWRVSPFVRLVMPLILGIIFGNFIDLNGVKVLVSIVPCLFVFLFFTLKQGIGTIPWYSIALNIILVLIGVLLVELKTESAYASHYSHYSDKQSYKVGTVIEPPLEKNTSYQLVVRVESLKHKESWITTTGKAIIYIQKGGTLPSLGDQIVFQQSLNPIKPPGNPLQFNYKKYLEYNNIYSQVYLPNGDYWVKENGSFNWYGKSNEIRDYLLGILHDAELGMDGESVAGALILGAKSELSQEQKKAYSNAGAMHVLAVSGLHVGFIYLLFNHFLSLFVRKKESWIKALVLIGLLWGYAVITGLGPSVVRSATMFSFVVIGNSLNRKTNIYNTLAASAFLLLIFNPFYLFTVGFQLSYLAVLGIVYFHPIINNWYYSRWWLLNKVWSLTAVSIAAQIATFPLSLYYFHQFPGYFLVANIVVIPLAMAILFLGVFLFMVFPFQWLFEALATMLKWLLLLLNTGVKWIEQLPMAVLKGFSISIVECLGIYSTILLLTVGFKLKRFWWVNLAIVVMILLVSNDVIENRSLNLQKRMLVAEIKGHTCINLVVGKSNFIISDEELIHHPKKLSLNLANYWDYLDAKPPILVELNKQTPQELVFELGEQKIMVINQTIPKNQVILEDIDVLIITKQGWCNPQKLSEKVKTRMVILDSSITYFDQIEWSKYFKNVYAVSQSGGYEYVWG